MHAGLSSVTQSFDEDLQFFSLFLGTTEPQTGVTIIDLANEPKRSMNLKYDIKLHPNLLYDP